MNPTIQFITAAAVLILALCGCGGNTGSVPETGYNTERVSYEPPPNPDATIFEFPTVDPLALPDPPLAFPEPHAWTLKMPVAFIGEIQRPPDSNGWILRAEISPIRHDGSLGNPEPTQIVARIQKGHKEIPYRMEVNSPAKPGRYHVAIKTVGPGLDLVNLETFAEGEIDVR